jgi:outer membrane lipase/esterase
MFPGVRSWCRGLRVLPWLVLAWLASCGGGTSQIEPFKPRQIIFIGDETVGLLPDGRRYGINFLNTDNIIDCTQLPIWSQQLASGFGIATDYCNAPGSPGVTRAVAGAKAADISAQIDAQIAATGVTSKDLYVVMVGLNDIIELYETFQGDRSCDSSNNNPPAGSLMAELRARGHLVGNQINRIIAAGGRLIVSTVHDLGYTPYAIAKNALVPGQTTLLSCMTAVFNARVRVDPVQDGRFWGLVLADDDTLAVVKNPGNFGVTNTTNPACTVALPDCTTSTLVPGATAGNYLWADDLHFGPVLNNQMASGANARAHNNPF